MNEVRLLLSGDTSLTVEFGNEISGDINSQIRAFSMILSDSKISGIVETVPTYRSITVHYDPEIIRYNELKNKLLGLVDKVDKIKLPPSRVLEIPVLYGGKWGPDLEFVAENNKLTPQEVVHIHASSEYLIYMLGFTPGFTYLGGMDERIATPRLKTPRLKIPAGSVGIAGVQTGIYPMDSPGGWQLIGQTPVHIYDANRAVPILPKAGQYIKFCEIDEAEFIRISSQEQSGTYEPRCYPRKETVAL